MRALMGSLAQSRRFTLSMRALSSIRGAFSADRADEDEVAATIRTVLRETGHFIDPHTAVGVAVAEKESRDPAVPMVVLGTAHAAKFPDAVEAACGQRPLLPEWLADLERAAGTRHRRCRSTRRRSNTISCPQVAPRAKELLHER